MRRDCLTTFTHPSIFEQWRVWTVTGLATLDRLVFPYWVPRSTSTSSFSIRPGASSVCSDGGVRLFRGRRRHFRDLPLTRVSHAPSQLVASMRHQAADRARRQQIAGHSAKDPFVEPAMAVSPGHQQIGAFVRGESDD